MERVKVYSPPMPERTGTRAVRRRPDGAISATCRSKRKDGSRDPRLRENFIERVFAYRRLKDVFAGQWTSGALSRFHTAHKMSLLSHSTTAYQALGRLVARASGAETGAA